MTQLTPAEMAAQDQAGAAHREAALVDARIARGARWVLLLVGLPLLAWAVLLAAGVVPPTPWSPMGLDR